MIIPESGYSKIIKCPAPKTLKEYEQLTLNRCFRELNGPTSRRPTELIDIGANVNESKCVDHLIQRCTSSEIYSCQMSDDDSCYSPTNGVVVMTKARSIMNRFQSQ